MTREDPLPQCYCVEILSSKVEITVAAQGILPRFRHLRKLKAQLLPWGRKIAREEWLRKRRSFPVQAVLPVDRIEPDDEDLDLNERKILKENLLSNAVLAGKNWPFILFSGEVNWEKEEAVTARGEVAIRGHTYPLEFTGTIGQEDDKWRGRFSFTGKLTQLGIKPFRGPMGLMWLRDWISVEVEVTLTSHPALPPVGKEDNEM